MLGRGGCVFGIFLGENGHGFQSPVPERVGF